jgi:hypothetical protein
LIKKGGFATIKVSVAHVRCLDTFFEVDKQDLIYYILSLTVQKEGKG